MIKIIQRLFLLFCILYANTISAQIKIGDNPSSINTASLLELESTNKGFLPPRITLNDVNNWTLTGTAVEGMLIYNESGSEPSGFYYWDGSQWVLIVSGTISNNTLNQAYDQGGSGAGRTIIADAGAVQISGAGGLNIGTNTMTNTHSLVVGQTNNVSGFLASITGGMLNGAAGSRSFVGGGFANEAFGDISSIGGGGANKTFALFSTIAGGNDNFTYGERSAIPGGVGLVTTAFGETVVGINNDTSGGSFHSTSSRVLTDPLFVVGNGSNNNSGRSNAFTISKDGNAILAGNLTQLSDKRLKTNINLLSGALTKILQLNAYTYNWKKAPNRSKDLQIGVLAQEVQAIFPELTTTKENGVIGVNYIGLVPVLIEATKEQQSIIESQKKELEETQQRLEQLENEMAEIKALLKKQ